MKTIEVRLTENAHKNAEMVAAKIGNMKLVVFCKPASESKWQRMSTLTLPDFSGTHDYFLCLPKHKEACLHCLNGGNVEATRPDGEPVFSSAFVGSTDHSIVEWGARAWYMNESCESRVKPKKEKRWIGVQQLTKRVTSTCETKEIARFTVEAWVSQSSSETLDDWQFIEIEVEV